MAGKETDRRSAYSFGPHLGFFTRLGGRNWFDQNPDLVLFYLGGLDPFPADLSFWGQVDAGQEVGTDVFRSGTVSDSELEVL